MLGRIDPDAECGHLSGRGASSATDRSVTGCVGCVYSVSEEGTF